MFYCFGWILRCKTTGDGNTGVATLFGFANGCLGAAEEEWWIITAMNISNVYFTKRKTLILGDETVCTRDVQISPQIWYSHLKILGSRRVICSNSHIQYPQIFRCRQKKKISCHSDLAPGYLCTRGVHVLFDWKSHWQKNCFQVTVIFVLSVILQGWTTIFLGAFAKLP